MSKNEKNAQRVGGAAATVTAGGTYLAVAGKSGAAIMATAKTIGLGSAAAGIGMAAAAPVVIGAAAYGAYKYLTDDK